MLKNKKQNWHSISTNKVVEILNTDFDGLSKSEAKRRLKKFGKNKLPEKKPLSKFKILIDQIRSPFIYILIIAGIVVLLFEEYTDAIVIFGAVFLNTVVGYVQENKASQALEKLREVIKIEAEVIRNGHRKKINQENLVVGDLIRLEAGSKVPADGRLIEANNLTINEAPLTGEWLAARKSLNILPEDTPMADRDNMAFMGSTVESGTGKMTVVSTGADTEMGKVATLVRETREQKTPLQKRLAHFSKIVGIIIALICALIFLGGVVEQKGFLEMFETAVAVAVAAIPEGLPVAMTIILALGMKRILRRKGLVRKLSAAETLGSTSVACTDKTLTLTKGEMVPAQTVTLASKVGGPVNGPRSLEKPRPLDSWTEQFKKEQDPDQMLTVAITTLCNEAFIENPDQPKSSWKIEGRPTDKALVLAGAKVDLLKPQLEKDYPKLDGLPFNTERKFLASLRLIKSKPGNQYFPQEKGNKILLVSGAPEKILELSSQVKIKNRQKRLDRGRREKLNKKLNRLTLEGLRVIATAYTKQGLEPKPKQLEDACNNLTLVGFIGLKDPLRKEAKQAIGLCRKAGMKPILVTGDHALTAQAVGRKLNLKTASKNTIQGKQLDEISDQELQKKISNIEIYSRVEPQHKLRIVKAWQKKGEVVAMTGDGVNDAPALKKADIGVALGSGTDVAKEVSELVLLTDNFNIMVAAVEEGRAILDNIRKVITYLLSDSFSETILIGISIILNLSFLPITAVQILYVNLIEDSLPGISLAFEPKEEGIMERNPQPKTIPLLNREMKAIIFIVGLLTDLILLGLFFWLFDKFGIAHQEYIQTMIFASLGIDSLFYVFSCKNLRENIWGEHILSNKFLIGGWIFGVIALLVAIYVPVFQTLLGTVGLGIWDWVILMGLGMSELVLIEAAKYYFIVRRQTEET